MSPTFNIGKLVTAEQSVSLLERRPVQSDSDRQPSGFRARPDCQPSETDCSRVILVRNLKPITRRAVFAWRPYTLMLIRAASQPMLEERWGSLCRELLQLGD